MRARPERIAPAGPDLAYPEAWFAAPNVHGPAAGRATAELLGEVGVIRGPRERRALERLAPERLGAWPFPGAGREALVTITLLCAAWAFHDDTLERTGRPDPRVALALREGSTRVDDPVVRAFAAAGAGLRGRSTAWRDRFVRSFEATVASVAEERALRAEVHTSGRAPSLRRYLAWRRVNVGLPAMLALVEHALDAELPEDARADPSVARFTAAATDLFLAANDLCSDEKDGPGGLNLVRSLGTRAAAVALHDAAVQRARRAELALRAGRPRDRALQAWSDAANHLLTGFAAWHATAPRYGLAPAPRRATAAVPSVP